MNLIAWSIPIFVAAIALELWLARRRHRDLYRFSVAVADMSCGVTQQLFGVLTTAGLMLMYWGVYQARLIELDPGAATTWLFGMVGVDLSYYVWHRVSHESNVFWAAHAVHHHSEDYNLAVALRQGLFTTATQIVFGLPLALLGLPPAVYLVCRALNALYQFWIHTELIGPLGPAERVLNTPSHHRVHHAVNPEYLDRNYGGILIVWDRLFGSFAPEVAAPVYGTTKRLRSLNPLYANLEPFREVGRRIAEATRLRDRAWAIFAHPSWRAAGPPVRSVPEELDARARERFAVATPRWLQGYVLAQMGGVVVATMLVLLRASVWPAWLVLGVCVGVGAGTVAFAGLAEGRRWAWPLEGARVALLVALFGAAGLA